MKKLGKDGDAACFCLFITWANYNPKIDFKICQILICVLYLCDVIFNKKNGWIILKNIYFACFSIKNSKISILIIKILMLLLFHNLSIFFFLYAWLTTTQSEHQVMLETQLFFHLKIKIKYKKLSNHSYRSETHNNTKNIVRISLTLI